MADESWKDCITGEKQPDEFKDLILQDNADQYDPEGPADVAPIILPKDEENGQDDEDSDR